MNEYIELGKKYVNIFTRFFLEILQCQDITIELWNYLTYDYESRTDQNC